MNLLYCFDEIIFYEAEKPGFSNARDSSAVKIDMIIDFYVYGDYSSILSLSQVI